MNWKLVRFLLHLYLFVNRPKGSASTYLFYNILRSNLFTSFYPSCIRSTHTFAFNFVKAIGLSWGRNTYTVWITHLQVSSWLFSDISVRVLVPKKKKPRKLWLSSGKLAYVSVFNFKVHNQQLCKDTATTRSYVRPWVCTSVFIVRRVGEL